MSAGAESGNKVRKLEYLFAAAVDEGADTVVTCGAAQSNHARATALLGARLGFRSLLFLRTPDPANPPSPTGNLLLDRLAGAEIRFITPADYARRAELMETARGELLREGQIAYVVPEGGSNGLGALGYVDAMREVREYLDAGFAGGPISFDAVVHAFGLEKIKTVGDGYLAVAGISEPGDLDVVAAAGAGLALHRAVADVSARRDRALSLRVGIARGPAMAGVLGRERLLYDLWGDAVNVAARLETAARPGETLITSDAARSIADTYALGPEVVLDLKGKGTMTVRSVITRR